MLCIDSPYNTHIIVSLLNTMMQNKQTLPTKCTNNFASQKLVVHVWCPQE